jgi:hypothetical protein
MTSIMSSPGGSAVYPNALTQLQGADQSKDGNGSATPSVTTPQTVPSLASVLSTDDTTGVGAQANSTITSLMMEIQALKAGTDASASTDASTAADETAPADPQQGGTVHGHRHHHHGGDGAAGATGQTSAAGGEMSQSDMQALAQDIVQQLTQVIQNFNNGYVDSSAYAGTGAGPVSTDQ